MTIGSLFSGIEGLGLGLEWAGLGPVEWQVEKDPYARLVLASRFPHVQQFDDVRAVGAHNLKRVDIICGGYPCQPFSFAGPRRGESDPRHLWPEYNRILGELRPRFAVLENVPGHLSMGFRRVLGDLAENGYDAIWFHLRASDVGAPQRRERLFVVAYRDGSREPQSQRRVAGERGRFGDCGWQMADADSEDGTSGPGHGERGGLTEPANDGLLADTDCARLEGRCEPERGSADERPARQSGTARLDDGGQGREPQSGLGRVFDGIPAGLDGGRWPARPGEEQHAWEPPRTCSKIPNRPARLKCLGNSVVPQDGYVVGRIVRHMKDMGLGLETA